MDEVKQSRLAGMAVSGTDMIAEEALALTERQLLERLHRHGLLDEFYDAFPDYYDARQYGEIIGVSEDRLDKLFS